MPYKFLELRRQNSREAQNGNASIVRIELFEKTEFKQAGGKMKQVGRPSRNGFKSLPVARCRKHFQSICIS
jgi:hypothetical protein